MRFTVYYHWLFTWQFPSVFMVSLFSKFTILPDIINAKWVVWLYKFFVLLYICLPSENFIFVLARHWKFCNVFIRLNKLFSWWRFFFCSFEGNAKFTNLKLYFALFFFNKYDVRNLRAFYVYPKFQYFSSIFFI